MKSFLQHDSPQIQPPLGPKDLLTSLPVPLAAQTDFSYNCLDYVSVLMNVMDFSTRCAKGAATARLLGLKSMLFFFFSCIMISSDFNFGLQKS